MPIAAAIARPVQCVASPGGSEQVSAKTRSTVSRDNCALPGTRARSRNKPSTPSSANRCCQRHTAGRLTPARRATSCTGNRSAD